MSIVINSRNVPRKLISLYPGFPKSISTPPNTEFFNDLETYLGVKVYPFSSARAALVFSLKALGFHRMDEVFVPPFLSDCVISAISKTAFPTLVATPRTRAIYVFHQFGFPQEIEEIESKAICEGWTIINCCVHSLFTKYNGEWLAGWGDFTIFSLPKLYPCGLGGGLITNNKKITKALDKNYPQLFELHTKWADRAYSNLMNANQSIRRIDCQFNIESVYGYLPNTVTFPTASYNGLPADVQSIIADIDRRKELLSSAENYLSTLMQVRKNDEVVPFALPLKMDQEKMSVVKKIFKTNYNARAEVLHFDYNQNMLKAKYEKALVLGCHEKWNLSILDNI